MITDKQRAGFAGYDFGFANRVMPLNIAIGRMPSYPDKELRQSWIDGFKRGKKDAN